MTIAAKKQLATINKIMIKDDDNIAKRTLRNENILKLKGLSSECTDLAVKVGIPDVARTWQTKKAIKNAVREANDKEIKELAGRQ